MPGRSIRSPPGASQPVLGEGPVGQGVAGRGQVLEQLLQLAASSGLRPGPGPPQGAAGQGGLEPGRFRVPPRRTSSPAISSSASGRKFTRRQRRPGWGGVSLGSWTVSTRQLRAGGSSRVLDRAPEPAGLSWPAPLKTPPGRPCPGGGRRGRGSPPAPFHLDLGGGGLAFRSTRRKSSWRPAAARWQAGQRPQAAPSRGSVQLRAARGRGRWWSCRPLGSHEEIGVGQAVGVEVRLELGHGPVLSPHSAKPHPYPPPAAASASPDSDPGRTAPGRPPGSAPAGRRFRLPGLRPGPDRPRRAPPGARFPPPPPLAGQGGVQALDPRAGSAAAWARNPSAPYGGTRRRPTPDGPAPAPWRRAAGQALVRRQVQEAGQVRPGSPQASRLSPRTSPAPSPRAPPGRPRAVAKRSQTTTAPAARAGAITLATCSARSAR